MLPPFTFREYLYFTKDVSLPRIALQDILKNNYDNSLLRYEYLFEDYLKGGLMPFSLEEPDILPLISNIREKIITADIPSVAKLTIDELKILEKVLGFIGASPADGINYSSISRNIGITKYKAEIYLKLFEQAFILNIVFPTGTNVLREPKVLMTLPWRLLYKEYNQAIGAIREDFFVEMFRMQHIPMHYLKSKRGAKTPDFLIKIDDEDCVVEVGKKGKSREQFKGIDVKNKVIFTHPSASEGIKRPLFLLGFI
jgi:predicted AAA+ superfamily ATPase